MYMMISPIPIARFENLTLNLLSCCVTRIGDVAKLPIRPTCATARQSLSGWIRRGSGSSHPAIALSSTGGCGVNALSVPPTQLQSVWLIRCGKLSHPAFVFALRTGRQSAFQLSVRGFNPSADNIFPFSAAWVPMCRGGMRRCRTNTPVVYFNPTS